MPTEAKLPHPALAQHTYWEDVTTTQPEIGLVVLIYIPVAPLAGRMYQALRITPDVFECRVPPANGYLYFQTSVVSHWTPLAPPPEFDI